MFRHFYGLQQHETFGPSDICITHDCQRVEADDILQEMAASADEQVQHYALRLRLTLYPAALASVRDVEREHVERSATLEAMREARSALAAGSVGQRAARQHKHIRQPRRVRVVR